MPRNEKKLDPAVFFVISIVLVLAVTTVLIAVNVRSDTILNYLENVDLFPLLIFVSEDKELIMVQLILINAETRNLAVYDVPRRFGTIIPSLDRVDRIDNLYRELGPAETRNTLQEIFDFPINFFLDLDTSDIEFITDLIEGVTVFLPIPIEDELDGRLIRIPGGNVTLDGEKLSSFITYEGEGERELEWVSRRWSFIREFFRSIGEYQFLYENEDVFGRFVQHFGANFNKAAIRTFINLLSTLRLDEMLTQRILGNEREIETSNGRDKILFPYFEGQLARDSIDQITQSLSSLDRTYVSALSSSLEILNGTKVNGLAARTSNLYQNFGFDIVRIANADRNDYDHTVIIYRKGDLGSAEKIGEIIRSDNIVAEQPLPTDPEIDITIILGNDFDGWYVQKVEAE